MNNIFTGGENMETAWIIIGFIIGVIVIVKGGDFFLDAATWIAEVSGVPKFVIGATVVSLATTLPEVFVSSIAAFDGKVDMAIGNAIGSVTANTGMIMAIGILFMPIVVKRKQFMNKGIILLTTIVALLLLSLSGELTIGKSLILLIIFGVFIFENLKSAKQIDGEKRVKVEATKKTTTTNIVKFIVGTAGIVLGSQLLVNCGSDIATLLGVPENIIGLTMIAIGTSLPELVTTITAIVKKESSISVGNIIGANIIDCALILPICSAISKGSLPVSNQVLRVDMPVCLLIACIAIIPALIKEKFYKWQGVTCLVIYFSYLSYICFLQ